MYDDLREFFMDKKNNPDYVVICFAVCLLVAAAAVYWLYADSHRNDGFHNDVNGTLERIETGIDDAGKRVDSITGKVAEAETSIGRTSDLIEASAGTITAGAERSDEIKDGIADCERRAAELVQGFGKIKNLMSDIEAANRQRTQGAQAAGVAK